MLAWRVVHQSDERLFITVSSGRITVYMIVFKIAAHCEISLKGRVCRVGVFYGVVQECDFLARSADHIEDVMRFVTPVVSSDL